MKLAAFNSIIHSVGLRAPSGIPAFWRLQVLSFCLMLSLLLCGCGGSSSENSPDDGSSDDLASGASQMVPDQFGQPKTSLDGSGSPTAGTFPANCPVVQIINRRGDKTDVHRGYVLQHKKGKAIIATNEAIDIRHYFNRSPRFPPRDVNQITISSSHITAREFPAEYVAVSPNRMWIFTAPANDLPAPLPTLTESSISVGMPIRIVLFDTPDPDQSYSPSAQVLQGNVKEIQPRQWNDPVSFTVSHDPIPRLPGGLIIGKHGELLGELLATNFLKSTSQDGYSKAVRISPPVEFADFAKVDLSDLDVSMFSDDNKQLGCRFSVRMNDVSQQLESGSLIWLRVRPVYGDASKFVEPRAPKGPYEPIDSAEEISLLPGELSYTHRNEFDTAPLFAPEKYRVGTLKVDPPEDSKMSRQEFVVQVVFQNASGEREYGRPQQASCNKIRIRKTIVAKTLPEKKPIAIPVADTPADRKLPQLIDLKLTKETDGGLRLTSDQTRLPVELPQLPDGLPQPIEVKAGEITIARAATSGESGKGLSGLVIQPVIRNLTSHQFFKSGGAFSSDGNTLYLVEPTNLLTKRTVTDLSCERYLNLPRSCNQIEMCGAGLLLRFAGNDQGRKDFVWVVDPESLEVLRQISLPGSGVMATGRKAMIGFCEAALPLEIGRRTGETPGVNFYMVDFETGILIHGMSVPNKEDRKSVPFKLPSENGGFHFARGISNSLLSSDGSVLILLDDGQLATFRIVHHDLIFEQVDTNSVLQVDSLFARREDKKEIAIFHKLRGGCAFYNMNDLKRPYAGFQKKTLGGTVLFDVKSDAWWACGDDQIERLKNLRARTGLYKLNRVNPEQVIISPTGGKMVLCGHSKFILINLPTEGEG